MVVLICATHQYMLHVTTIDCTTHTHTHMHTPETSETETKMKNF